MLKVNITGAAEVNKVLKMLPAEIATKVSQSALRSGANVVRDAVKERAPVSNQYSAKRSVVKGSKGKQRSELIKLKNEIKVSLTEKSTNKINMAVHVGRAYWGMFKEFGTSKMSATPFMRPGYETSKGEALDRIGVALGKGIERAATRLSGQFGKSGLAKRRR